MGDGWKDKSNRIIDLFILVCAGGSFLSSLTILFLEPDVQKALFNIDILVALTFFLLYLLRKKTPLQLKTLFIILIGAYAAVHSLIDAGSVRAVIPIMSAYITIAFLYLSAYVSVILASLSILTLLSYGVAVEVDFLSPDAALLGTTGRFSYWLYTALMMTINIVFVGSVILSMKKEQAKYIEQLESRAFNDPISGLKNYEGMREYITSRLAAGQSKSSLFILLDIRNFRLINSLYGIEFGDRVLKALGGFLKGYEGPDIRAARLSDDEFCLWIEKTDESDINQRLERMDKLVAEKLPELDRSVSLFLYKGMVSFPEQGNTFDDLFSRAGLALKEAKNLQTQNLIPYTARMESRTAFDNRVAMEISRSIIEDDFIMYYQKKFDVHKQIFCGAEALVRWDSKRLNLFNPGEFLPVVHKSNQIIPFSRYIVEKVFKDIPDLQSRLGRDSTVSINIPPILFLSRDFTEAVNKLMKDYAIAPGTVIFEITEDIFIENIDKVNAIINEIKTMGIGIALDDFGKGFSSLSYLRTINIDELKIDKSFIDNISLDEKSYRLFQSICDIGEIYGFKVIAEGVETREQADRISKTGCSVIQGYFYSRPEPLKELSNSIKKT